jgi:hypothetical protein
MNALRDWWRHRNDPPAMLPDPVRWTVQCFSEDEAALTIRCETRDGWEYLPEDRRDWDGTIYLTFRREDGAYRWRDDSFQGF